jgi:hypothetical protein
MSRCPPVGQCCRELASLISVLMPRRWEQPSAIRPRSEYMQVMAAIKDASLQLHAKHSSCGWHADAAEAATCTVPGMRTRVRV